jgi:hypothetical protein
MREKSVWISLIWKAPGFDQWQETESEYYTGIFKQAMVNLRKKLKTKGKYNWEIRVIKGYSLATYHSGKRVVIFFKWICVTEKLLTRFADVYANTSSECQRAKVEPAYQVCGYYLVLLDWSWNGSFVAISFGALENLQIRIRISTLPVWNHQGK